MDINQWKNVGNTPTIYTKVKYAEITKNMKQQQQYNIITKSKVKKSAE